MSKFRSILMVLLALTLAGCGNSASQRLIGKWKCDFAKAAAKAAGKMTEKEEDARAAAVLNMVQAMGMKMEMILEFKSDQTLNVTTNGIPSPFSGPMTWKTIEGQGDKLTIEITNPKEKTPSKVQITFNDNDHLQFIPPDPKVKCSCPFCETGAA